MLINFNYTYPCCDWKSGNDRTVFFLIFLSFFLTCNDATCVIEIYKEEKTKILNSIFFLSKLNAKFVKIKMQEWGTFSNYGCQLCTMKLVSLRLGSLNSRLG